MTIGAVSYKYLMFWRFIDMTTRDGDIDRNTRECVPVGQILKCYLVLGWNGLFEKFEATMSCSGFLRKLNQKVKNRENRVHNCGKMEGILVMIQIAFHNWDNNHYLEQSCLVPDREP